MNSEHASKTIVPWPHEPTKPICIRVFLNDDGSQYGADLCATWGKEPPGLAITVVYENVWSECGECGHYEHNTAAHGTNWRLYNSQALAFSDGIIAFYRKEIK